MLHPPLNLWSCGQREEAAAHNSTGQIKIKQSIGVFSKPLEIQMRQILTLCGAVNAAPALARRIRSAHATCAPPAPQRHRIFS